MMLMIFFQEHMQLNVTNAIKQSKVADHLCGYGEGGIDTRTLCLPNGPVTHANHAHLSSQILK